MAAPAFDGAFVITRSRAKLATAMAEVMGAPDDDIAAREAVVKMCVLNLSTAQRIVHGSQNGSLSPP